MQRGKSSFSLGILPYADSNPVVGIPDYSMLPFGIDCTSSFLCTMIASGTYRK